LTEERIAQLEALGFGWTLRSLTPWETRLQELKAYKKKHGHVQVPQKDKDHKGLARWVDTQRQQARMKKEGKKSQITDDRIAKLDAIGMKWVITDPQVWECKLLGTVMMMISAVFHLVSQRQCNALCSLLFHQLATRNSRNTRLVTATAMYP